MRRELLTPDQMGACDAFTIARGTPGTVLMERAGQTAADTAMGMVAPGACILIMAGPGNNGGDGYVAGRLLTEAGFDVTLLALGDTGALRGDAKWAFEGWKGPVLPADAADQGLFDAQSLVVDALFGAGLVRALVGDAEKLVMLANHARCPVLAVDLPSGLDGRTGRPLGSVANAKTTITFHRLKPGHVLHPGRALCGRLVLADIGLDTDAIGQSGHSGWLTGNYLWNARHAPAADAHKYAHGHALVVAGPAEKAGAGFLMASAALRIGTGLVTLAAPSQTLAGSIGTAPALMRATCNNAANLGNLLQEKRLTCCALGPGLAPNEATRQMVYAALESHVALVLDAGALSAFKGMAEALFGAIAARQAPVVLTPHAGEFTALFGLQEGSKIEQVQAAAKHSGATLVLKGADTVIGGSTGEAEQIFVNASAPPWLATAGSGDVLCGIIAGLMARNANEPAIQAALGVWLHGKAGQEAGPALVASDLEPALRRVLQRLDQTEFEPVQADEPG